MTRIDPITAAVFQGAMATFVPEMGYKLLRLSHSSIIRESEDSGAALTDASGRQLCECCLSTPRQSGPIPGYVRNILVTLAARGDALTVALTGTAPQIPDRPINLPLVGTVDCAIWLTFRSIFRDAVVVGPVPQNEGLTRPITIIAPVGSLANPIVPAPVIARFCPGNQLAHTVMKAPWQAVPDQVSAGIGNLRVVALSGLNHGNHWVHMQITEGSYGGRFGSDGLDAVNTRYANTRNNPVEDIESRVPLRVERYELRENAMAPGKWRGGIGAIREFRFLSVAGFAVEGDGHAYAPWGFQGGGDGFTAALALVASDGTERPFPSKLPYARVKAGDRLISVAPGDGGSGDAQQRDTARVARDMADGLISATAVLQDYGATISADGRGQWP